MDELFKYVRSEYIKEMATNKFNNTNKRSNNSRNYMF